MQSKGHTIVATLPNELIIHIFQLASATSLRFSRSLCLVSSWTRELASRHLLASVVLEDVSKAAQFADYVAGNSDHASFVRNLWLGSGIEDDVTGLLQFCPCLVNLAVAGKGLRRIDPSTLTHPHIQAQDLQLSLHDGIRKHPYNPNSLVNHPRSRPLIYTMVTHIHITYGFPFRDVRPYASKFPRLTHLAIPVDVDSINHIYRYIYSVLASKTLVMLVLVIERRVSHPVSFFRLLYRHLQETADPQIYIAWCRPGSEQEQWLDEVEGRYNIWERAVIDTEEYLEITR